VSLFSKLLKPSASISIAVLLLVGIGVGVAGMLAWDFTMHATSTEKFCISCHEMESGPYAHMQDRPHFKNQYGVTATCSDCHLPHSGWPKIWRKIQASREVWATVTGKIDTPEKYQAHLQEMQDREIARLKASDSRECRNCHKVESMVLEAQSKMAKRSHASMQEKGQTCIDCHEGIGHDSQGEQQAALVLPYPDSAAHSGS
jgi:cytochrome c-type protein NapC